MPNTTMTKAKIRSFVFMLLLAFLSLSIYLLFNSSSRTFAAIPRVVNYQAQIKNLSGVPIDTAKSMRFELFTVSTGGTAVWTEEWDGSAPECPEITPNSSGIFSVRLGTCVAFPASVNFAEQYYLEVSIERPADDGVLETSSTRVPLSSSPYAMNAGNVTGISFPTNTSSAFSIGDIAGNGYIELNSATGEEKITFLKNVVIGTVPTDLFTVNATMTVGSGTLYVDSVNQMVGIGTETPTNALHVVGGITVEAGAPSTTVDALYNNAGDLYWDGSKLLIQSDQHWAKSGTILSPYDTNVERIDWSKTVNNLIGMKISNANDTGNYAGSVIELKGSGADYTNNMYFGKYGDGFWVPSWAGNGVIATDQNLVVAAVGGTSQVQFQVGGGYTAPNTVMTLDNNSLDLLSGSSLHVSGRIGIGTTNPSTELEVVGDVVSSGTKWTSRTSAADINWRSVTYGNGVFLALAYTGSGSQVMISSDGINWRLVNNGINLDWTSVTYGNGLFVAVASSGTGNRVMTSSDGINWVSRTSAADNNWYSVTYGNNMFVAVSNSGVGNRVMTSPDGINWTTQASAADNDWYSVTYGNGTFVAVSTTGTGNRVMTSTDGINWVSRTSAANNQWLAVTYGNGLFVAVSSTGTGNRVMTSPNGTTWTIRTTPADNNWAGVTYGNGLFVAVAYSGTGNRVMTSPDGINWTIRTSAANNDWKSIVYANGMFVAVADSGTGNRVMSSGKFNSNVVANNNTYYGGMTVMSGSIGVGTSTPTNALHINGGITLASTPPATTTYALYNQGGDLYWDGNQISLVGVSSMTLYDTYNVTIDDLGKSLRMDTTDSKTFILPSVDSSQNGERVTIQKTNTGRVRIMTSDADVFENNGNIVRNSSDTTGDSITFEYVHEKTMWIVVAGNGEWAFQEPLPSSRSYFAYWDMEDINTLGVMGEFGTSDISSNNRDLYIPDLSAYGFTAHPYQEISNDLGEYAGRADYTSPSELDALGLNPAPDWFDASNDFSVITRARSNRLLGDSEQQDLLFSYQDIAGVDNTRILLMMGQNQEYFLSINDADDDSVTVTGNMTFTANEWVTIGVSVDWGDDIIRLYFDGVLDKEEVGLLAANNVDNMSLLSGPTSLMTAAVAQSVGRLIDMDYLVLLDEALESASDFDEAVIDDAVLKNYGGVDANEIAENIFSKFSGYREGLQILQNSSNRFIVTAGSVEIDGLVYSNSHSGEYITNLDMLEISFTEVDNIWNRSDSGADTPILLLGGEAYAILGGSQGWVGMRGTVSKNNSEDRDYFEFMTAQLSRGGLVGVGSGGIDLRGFEGDNNEFWGYDVFSGDIVNDGVTTPYGVPAVGNYVVSGSSQFNGTYRTTGVYEYFDGTNWYPGAVDTVRVTNSPTHNGFYSATGIYQHYNTSLGWVADENRQIYECTQGCDVPGAWMYFVEDLHRWVIKTDHDGVGPYVHENDDNSYTPREGTWYAGATTCDVFEVPETLSFECTENCATPGAKMFMYDDGMDNRWVLAASPFTGPYLNADQANEHLPRGGIGLGIDINSYETWDDGVEECTVQRNPDVIGVALDRVSGSVWFSVNGVWQGGGDPETNTSPAFTGLSGDLFTISSLLDGGIMRGKFGFEGTQLNYPAPTGFADGYIGTVGNDTRLGVYVKASAGDSQTLTANEFVVASSIPSADLLGYPQQNRFATPYSHPLSKSYRYLGEVFYNSDDVYMNSTVPIKYDPDEMKNRSTLLWNADEGYFEFDNIEQVRDFIYHPNQVIYGGGIRPGGMIDVNEATFARVGDRIEILDSDNEVQFTLTAQIAPVAGLCQYLSQDSPGVTRESMAKSIINAIYSCPEAYEYSDYSIVEGSKVYVIHNSNSDEGNGRITSPDIPEPYMYFTLIQSGMHENDLNSNELRYCIHDQSIYSWDSYTDTWKQSSGKNVDYWKDPVLLADQLADGDDGGVRPVGSITVTDYSSVSAGDTILIGYNSYENRYKDFQNNILLSSADSPNPSSCEFESSATPGASNESMANSILLALQNCGGGYAALSTVQDSTVYTIYSETTRVGNGLITPSGLGISSTEIRGNVTRKLLLDGEIRLAYSNDKMYIWSDYENAWRDLVDGISPSALQIMDTDGDTGITVEVLADEDTIRMSTAGVERITILNNGNTGFGTDAPGRTVDLRGELAFDGYLLSSQSNGLYFGKTNLTDSEIEISSESYGENWIEQTGAGITDRNGVAMSADGRYQTAVVINGNIQTSSDYGVTWTSQPGSGSRNWSFVTMSSDGKYQYATVNGGYIYRSSDYGVTWVELTASGSRNWRPISASSDGKIVYAGGASGYIYKTTDYGNTWEELSNLNQQWWSSLAVSSDGRYITAVAFFNYLYTSDDYGNTWIQNPTIGSKSWQDVSMSANGRYQTAVASNDYIYVSSDYGQTWIQKNAYGSRSWYAVGISADGKYQTVAPYESFVHVSSDYGQTWTEITSLIARQWRDVAVSSTGQHQLLSVQTGGLFTSTADLSIMNGYLGLGVDNPDNALHINGGITLNPDAPVDITNALYNVGGALYWNGSSLTGSTPDSIQDADGDTRITAEESADEDVLRFYTDGTQRMTIDSEGNIGIGTDSPTAKLDVAGNISNLGAIYESDKSSYFHAEAFAVGNNFSAMEIKGNYAYVLDQTDDVMRVIDISNRTSQFEVGIAYLAAGPIDIKIAGNFAYIATRSGTLDVIDISNPSSPNVVSSISFGTSASGLVVYGKYVILAADVEALIQTIDISNPDLPVLVSSLSIGAGNLGKLSIDGTRMYATSVVDDVKMVFDISNPTSVQMTSSYNTGDFGAYSMKSNGRYAFVANTLSDTLEIIDIQNMYSPNVVNTETFPAGSMPKELDFAGNYLYVLSSATSTIRIYDIEQGVYTPYINTMETIANPTDIVIHGHYAYVIDDQGYFYMFDISGIETNGLLAHSAVVGNLVVNDKAGINGDLLVSGNLSVGEGGIISEGALLVRDTLSVQQGIELGENADILLTENGSIVFGDDKNAVQLIGEDFYLGNVKAGGPFTISDLGGNIWVDNGVFFASGALDSDGTAISADGKYQAVAITGAGNNIYVSSDYGKNWNAYGNADGWSSIAMSADGRYMTSVNENDNTIYISDDYGVTWNSSFIVGNWSDLAISHDGSFMAATEEGMDIYVSTDYGASWNGLGQSATWGKVAISKDGKYVTAFDYSNGVAYMSSEYGENMFSQFLAVPFNPTEGFDLAMSADGKVQVLAIDSMGSGPDVYVSTDYGASWGNVVNVGGWYTGNEIVMVSGDGRIINVLHDAGDHLASAISMDYGATWSTDTALTSFNEQISNSITSGAMSLDGKSKFIITMLGSYYSNNPKLSYTGGLSLGSSVATPEVLNVNGSITLGDFTIEPDSGLMSNALYNVGGNLFWNGNNISNVADTVTSDFAMTSAYYVGNVEKANIFYLRAGFGSSKVYIDGDYMDGQIVIVTNESGSNITVRADGTNVLHDLFGTQVEGVVVPTGQVVGFINSGGNFYQMIGVSSSGAGDSIWDADTDTGISAESQPNEDVLRFYTASQQRMTIDSLGNVGIGAEDLARKFEVNEEVSLDSQLFSSESNGLYIGRNRFSENLLQVSGIGDSWVNYGNSQYWNSVGMSSDGKYISAGTWGISIERSSDFGRTWSVSSSPVSNWRSIALSASGQYQLASANSDTLYISSDYGVNWTSVENSRSWQGVAISSDGRFMIAGAWQDAMYLSSDFGATWEVVGLESANRQFYSIAMSSDGRHMVVAVRDDYIYVSHDYGKTWAGKDGTRNWWSVAMSSSGEYITAGDWGGNLYLSYDYGENWNPTESARNWVDVKMSYDGRIQGALDNGGFIYISEDYGQNWTQKAHSSDWMAMGISADAKYLVAVASSVADMKIYMSDSNSYQYGKFGLGTSAPGTDIHVVNNNIDGNVITIQDSNGTCTLNPGSGASWSCSSDINLKHDIQQLTLGLEVINKLKPSTFKMNADNSEAVGFIAQEVQEVLPGLVSVLPDGNLGVKEGGLIPYLVRAIQEQQAQIDSLSGGVATSTVVKEVTVTPEMLDQLVIEGKLEVDGLAYFGKDVVGEAVVKAGEAEVSVLFETEYSTKPVVVITKISAGVVEDYYVDEITKTGFKIKIDPTKGNDVYFSWHSFASKDGLRVFSDGAKEPLE